MKTLGMTHSVCGRCRQVIPAKDGREKTFVHGDVEQYLRAQRFVKPAWAPLEFAGQASKPCPEGCGMCSRHEQHLCMPIVEITARCDLDCPVCLASAGRDWDMSLDEFRRLLDGLIRAERQVDILTLSGGEPLVHPRILEFLDELARRPAIVRASVSTNGLSLLRNPQLLPALAARNAVVSLQFDGFDDGVYRTLRGRDLLAQKLRILDLLAESEVTTSLTVTLAGGVNEPQLGPILDYVFSHRHVVSLMIQPVAFAGRAQGMPGREDRLTIPDVIGLLGGTGKVATEDFAPLPCSHPLCFSLAYYLMLDGGGRAPVNRLVQADGLMDSLSNRTVFGLDEEEHERLKDMVYDLWSGPAGTAPDAQAVLDTLRNILGEMSGACFDARQAFTVAQRRIKSVFIHAFQDADTFDLARVRRCCNAYPQPDGRLVPACVHNVMGGRP
ncbi:MAG: radical SAM protein [Planctomycetota bacterium]|nr:radical SAM protein [Planctomycetota bacterium]